MTLFFAAMMTVSACGAKRSGPPVIEIDRSACSHCGMLISELIYAAAYQAPRAEARVFDDIGCLRTAARGETGPLTLWFHDAEDGKWIDGGRSWFVSSPEIRTPMGGGLLAYRSEVAARRAADAGRGRVINSVADMLSDTKGEM